MERYNVPLLEDMDIFLRIYENITVKKLNKKQLRRKILFGIRLCAGLRQTDSSTGATQDILLTNDERGEEYTMLPFN